MRLVPSPAVTDPTWNVHIKELLILYFLHALYNPMDYLSLAAAPLCAYKSSIESRVAERWLYIHSCEIHPVYIFRENEGLEPPFQKALNSPSEIYEYAIACRAIVVENGACKIV